METFWVPFADLRRRGRRRDGVTDGPLVIAVLMAARAGQGDERTAAER